MAFAAERALWAQEKAALKLALAQAESDAIHASRVGDDTDTSDRVSACQRLLERLSHIEKLHGKVALVSTVKNNVEFARY
jgi:hypothetical protein